MTTENASQISLSIQLTELPQCPSCKASVMLPLQDAMKDNNAVVVKAWVCPGCLHNVMMRMGELMVSKVAKL